MLIIAGKLYVDATVRDSYLTDCARLIEQARAAEGCLDFHLSADPVEPDRINVYERWESAETLERFRGSGPPSGQTSLIRSADVRRYVISSVEAP